MSRRHWAAGIVLALSLHGLGHAQTIGAGDAAAPLAGCDTDLVRLNQLTGWQVQWPQELAALARRPAADRAAALPRWRAAAAGLDADMAALERHRRAGTTAPKAVVQRVLAQIDALVATPAAPGLTDPDWRAFLDGELTPKARAFADYLRTAYLPAAGETSDLASSETGRRCFEQAAARWTSRSMTSAEIEATGRTLLARYRLELQTLEGVEAAAIPATLAHLRDGEGRPAATREDILRISRDAIDRAVAAAPAWFDASPAQAPLEVEPIATALEATLPAGFYAQAAGDEPARYLINLSRPSDRRLMAEVIAFHEAVPGHHLAFSTARRPGTFNSGFVEGWAIYAEHLADEMGLYGGREDRLGMVAKHLWAASRLIVEPGLHVHGWTRDEAVAFLLENTALSRAEIEVEVDRYLAMPGQSLAYMIGYETLRAARERTEAAQGAAFDIRAFHGRVLAPGSRPLDQLAAEFP